MSANTEIAVSWNYHFAFPILPPNLFNGRFLVEESEVDSELITDDDDSDSSAEEVSSSDQGRIITLLKSWKTFIVHLDFPSNQQKYIASKDLLNSF